MTYTELSDSIKSYLQNYEADFVGAIPTFVRQAEQRVSQVLNLPVARVTETVALTTGDPIVVLPEGVLALDSVMVTTTTGLRQYMLPKDRTFMAEAYPDATVVGTPKYYGIEGPDTGVVYSLVVGPAPDDAYNLEVKYTGYPESIVTAGNTWVGDNLDALLLYGSLIEGCIFMKGEEDMMKAYEAKYQEALAAAKNLVNMRQRRDNYRDRG